jgi:predicted amidohydrolase YtcJ
MSVTHDIILCNGKIYTMGNQSRPDEAIAIKEGKVVSTGSNKDIKNLSDRNTMEIDLEGRSVFPGFMDTHMHLESVADGLLSVNLKKVRTIDEVLHAIRENIPKEPDTWLTSSWWHPFSQLREKRLPTRFEIDEVCPNNPVYLPIVGHIAIANSRALEIAGIRDSSSDPEGGKIDRNSVTGSVTGVLHESAIRLVQKWIPPHDQKTLENKYREVMDACNKFGITSIVTGTTTPEELKIWQNLRSKDDMNLRVNVSYLPTGEEAPLVPEEEFGSALNELKAFASIDDPFLSLGYIKFILDGGMTLETAAITKPYMGDSENFGMLTMDQQRLNTLVDICNRKHFRVGIHAVGDRAIDAVLEAYEEANKKSSIKDRRFILIHGFLIRPDQIDRALHLGLLVAIQNVFMYEKAQAAERFLGETRASMAIPTKSMIKGGLVVTGGSDADVNSFNPFLGIYQAVTRKSKQRKIFGLKEKIDRWEAVCMYTKWAAMQTFEENVKGVLEPGKFADLIVTSSDILTCPEEEIENTQVIMTMIGGKVVYSADDTLFRCHPSN